MVSRSPPEREPKGHKPYDLGGALSQGAAGALDAAKSFEGEARPESVDHTSAAARHICGAISFLRSLEDIAQRAHIDAVSLLKQQACTIGSSVSVLRRALVMPFLGFHRTPFSAGPWVGPCATAVMLEVGADLQFMLWALANGLDVPPTLPIGATQWSSNLPGIDLDGMARTVERLSHEDCTRILRRILDTLPKIGCAAIHAVLVNEHAFATRHPLTASAKADEAVTVQATLAKPLGSQVRAVPHREKTGVAIARLLSDAEVRFGSYGELARELRVDPRTVRRHVAKRTGRSERVADSDGGNRIVLTDKGQSWARATLALYWRPDT